jgi:hypothetical protein
MVGAGSKFILSLPLSQKAQSRGATGVQDNLSQLED